MLSAKTYNHKAYEVLCALYAKDQVGVRIKHPYFGYVESVVFSKWSGGKLGAEFTDSPAKAAVYTSSQLRCSQDANGNGLLALLVASYGGLALVPVVDDSTIRFANVFPAGDYTL